MFDFCPHCGQTLSGQPQNEGQVVFCRMCGKEIGAVAATRSKTTDRTEEAPSSGGAARCPDCGQAVEVKVSGGVPSFVPHFVASGPRKMCPKSGKPISVSSSAPVASAAKRPPAGKDLSAYYTRETIKVVACRRDGDPTIESLNLEYLDKSDRVRMQIDAIRDILGASFRMRTYPPELKRPDFLMWAGPDACVIAKKNDGGGYRSLSDREIAQAVEDLRNTKPKFFGG